MKFHTPNKKQSITIARIKRNDYLFLYNLNLSIQRYVYNWIYSLVQPIV